jgi:DNA mismatch endonuclease (patch repair protein)
VSQWGTHRVPVGYTPCPSGVHTVSQWGTHRVPVGHTPCPSGAHTVSQWGTHRVPAEYPPCPSGVRTQRDPPRAPTGQPRDATGPAPCPNGRAPCPKRDTPRAQRNTPRAATRHPRVAMRIISVSRKQRTGDTRGGRRAVGPVRTQIGEVAPTPAKRKALRGSIRTCNPILQASINVIGALDNDNVSQAVGQPADGVRQLYDEANRWTAVEDELRMMLNGVSGANLIRRQRIALITEQAVTIGAQLARDPANAVLVPHVQEIKRLKSFNLCQKAAGFRLAVSGTGYDAAWGHREADVAMRPCPYHDSAGWLPLLILGRRSTRPLAWRELVSIHPMKPRSAAAISRNMSAVRSRDGKAERILRKALWHRGFRFRLYRQDLVGRPDLTFSSMRLAVFVDGDFWHGRLLIEKGPEALLATFHTSRADWWLAKITRTVERDQEVTAALRASGWTVVRFWERDILKSPEHAFKKIAKILRRTSSAGPGSGASTQIPQRRSGSAVRRSAGEAVARNPVSAPRRSGTRRRRST